MTIYIVNTLDITCLHTPLTTLHITVHVYIQNHDYMHNVNTLDMLWTSTSNIHQSWSLFVHILYGLLLCRCNPMFPDLTETEWHNWWDSQEYSIRPD